jgi:hypothetical protein
MLPGKATGFSSAFRPPIKNNVPIAIEASVAAIA